MPFVYGLGHSIYKSRALLGALIYALNCLPTWRGLNEDLAYEATPHFELEWASVDSHDELFLDWLGDLYYCKREISKNEILKERRKLDLKEF